MKAVKAFKELKNANKLLTLEALTSAQNVEKNSPKKQAEIFGLKEKRFVHEGRQGKHLTWHEKL